MRCCAPTWSGAFLVGVPHTVIGEITDLTRHHGRTSQPLGMKLPPFDVVVEAEPMKVFSLITNDANPIHWDLQAVRDAGPGERVINQGEPKVGYVLDALCHLTGSWHAVRKFETRFLKNVFTGSRLTAGEETVSVGNTENARTAQLTVWLRRAAGDELLMGTATVDLPATNAEDY